MTIAERLTTIVATTRGWIARHALDTRACFGCGIVAGGGVGLVQGPGLPICERCVQRASTALEGWRPGELRSLVAGATARGCAFCGTARADALGLVAWSSGAICGECVALCEEIVGQQRSAPGVLPPDERAT